MFYTIGTSEWYKKLFVSHLVPTNLYIPFQDERTFSEEEEEKLQSSLSLTDGDLELVIHTLEFILHQVRFFLKAEHYSNKALCAGHISLSSLLSLNLYISCRPINSSKYFTLEVSPVWTYIAMVLDCNGTINFVVPFPSQEKIKHQMYCLLHYLLTENTHKTRNKRTKY